MSGPTFVTVTVQVMISPNLALGLETTLTTTKSALGAEVVLLVPLVLLPGVSLVTLATLTIVLLVIFTIVEISNTLLSPLAKSPIIQTPDSGS